ncbi:MAG: hypothetical protein ABWY13_14420 [Mesorhizobium sp.]|jgi:hypothetical protein|nr:hypothetical protein [Mesorhizobium sp.]
MRRTILLSLAGLAIAAIPSAMTAFVWFTNPDPEQLDAAIRRLGFYPITPPNLLRAPGTIYHVTTDGRFTSALCEVGADRLKDFVEESPTEATISEELRKVSLGIDAKIPEMAQSTSDASLLQAVNYQLDDVKVLEVSIEELSNIATELQKRPGCQASILEYLTAGEYVCQVQQVLMASANYTVSTEALAKGVGTLDAVLSAITANIDPNARLTGSTKVTGTGLYYGMKIAPRCMSLIGETPRRPPITWQDRLLNSVGLLN